LKLITVEAICGLRTHPATPRQAATQENVTTIDLFFRSEEVVVERLSMRKIREMRRLKFEVCLSARQIVLRRPGVILALLWQQYRLAQPQGFQYSWFSASTTASRPPR